MATLDQELSQLDKQIEAIRKVREQSHDPAHQARLAADIQRLDHGERAATQLATKALQAIQPVQAPDQKQRTAE